MPINYCLVPRTTNPHDPKAKWLVYAAAQSRRTLTVRDIAQHIHQHNSPFSVGTIVGLLEDAQQCIAEHLADGSRVDLGALGTFFTTISSSGAERAEEFTQDYIRSVNLRWLPSKDMKKRLAKEPFVEVPTRPSLQRAKREEKQRIDEERAAQELTE